MWVPPKLQSKWHITLSVAYILGIPNCKYLQASRVAKQSWGGGHLLLLACTDSLLWTKLSEDFEDKKIFPCQVKAFNLHARLKVNFLQRRVIKDFGNWRAVFWTNALWGANYIVVIIIGDTGAPWKFLLGPMWRWQWCNNGSFQGNSTHHNSKLATKHVLNMF